MSANFSQITNPKLQSQIPLIETKRDKNYIITSNIIRQEKKTQNNKNASLRKNTETASAFLGGFNSQV